jgi:hypothetical protein
VTRANKGLAAVAAGVLAIVAGIYGWFGFVEVSITLAGVGLLLCVVGLRGTTVNSIVGQPYRPSSICVCTVGPGRTSAWVRELSQELGRVFVWLVHLSASSVWPSTGAFVLQRHKRGIYCRCRRGVASRLPRPLPRLCQSSRLDRGSGAHMDSDMEHAYLRTGGNASSKADHSSPTGHLDQCALTAGF